MKFALHKRTVRTAKEQEGDDISLFVGLWGNMFFDPKWGE